MGTYRQPSQVIDKSFDTLNQGLENVNQKISDGLIFQRNQEIAKAKEAKKEQEKRNKELKDLRDRQQAAADGYQVEIDNFENINQPRTDSWEQEDVTVTNQIKNNSKYFLDIMSNNLPGTEAYRRAERALKNMIKQYPVMASLFNQESEQTDSAFVNGVQIGENEDGAILNSNDPLQSVKLHMLRDLKTGANPERFQVLSLPSGQVFKYEDADGKVFETAYQDYVDFRESGGNLIDTVNGEEYNTFMDGIWNKTLKKTYDTLSTKITSYREGIRNGDPVNFKDVEVSYTQANKNLDNTLDNWVDGGGSVSQSTWQMLGGSGVYNPEENKEQLKTYLKTKVKDRFTTQEDKYTLSEQEILKGGGKGSGKEEEVVDLSTINLSDVESIITDTRKQVADYRKTEKPNPVEELKIREESSKKIANILNDEFKNEILKFGDEKIEIDSFDVQTDSNGNFTIQPLEISRGKLAEAGVSYIIKDFDDLNKFKKHLRAGDKELSRILETKKENKKDPLNLGI